MLQKCLLNKEPYEDCTVMMDNETETQLMCDRASFRAQVCLTQSPMCQIQIEFNLDQKSLQ